MVKRTGVDDLDVNSKLNGSFISDTKSNWNIDSDCEDEKNPFYAHRMWRAMELAMSISRPRESLIFRTI